MNTRLHARRHQHHHPKGTILVLSVVLMVFFLAMLAFAIDVGYGKHKMPGMILGASVASIVSLIVVCLYYRAGKQLQHEAEALRKESKDIRWLATLLVRALEDPRNLEFLGVEDRQAAGTIIMDRLPSRQQCD